MSGRTWKEITEADSEHIKSNLIDNGGIERKVKGEVAANVLNHCHPDIF